ncbi:MAG: hypothetical protein P9M03_00485 [Candidatus Theseobacter exili]|nr:hypothetical protein [Candidatus Theseobacter exili]
MLVSIVKKVTDHIRYRITVRNWNKKGNPIPVPDVIKQKTVKEYAKIFSVETFIETGTYLGDMVDAVRDTFKKIYSIELDKTLYEQAKKKFSKHRNILILHGDSSKVLPVILADISEPCLFWLDAHYSKGITAKGDFNTPIMQELNCILDHFVEGNIILIDDAREFNGFNDYPTLEELKKCILKKCPDWKFDIQDDIIRIHKHD